MKALASRTFSAIDQREFARLSGDVNPMHMDDVAARRTQAGAAVVHGMHLALWTLDELARSGAPVASLSSVRILFKKFVPVGSTATLRVAASASGSIKCEILVENVSCVTATLGFGAPAAHTGLPDDLATVVTHGAPIERRIDELANLRGWLSPPDGSRELATRHLASAVQALGSARVDALAQLSTLVGMVCPGLHSIFSELRLDVVTAPADSRPGIGFATTAVDERFALASMTVAGSGIAGEVSAFLRARPFEPPSMAALAERVGEREFAGSVALVVGGSRGLGAVTAKLIASGGGRVIATYSQGVVEAESLADDIRAARGTDACAIAQLDVTRDPASVVAALPDEITHVYYFATPRIFRQTTELYSAAVFEEFARVYLDGFCRTVEPLLVRGARPPLRVLHPSSIAVESRPKGITEYAMAKAAQELLCADMVQRYPGTRIEAPRLPRILTDQTATVSGVEAADAVETMLPLMRRLHAP